MAGITWVVVVPVIGRPDLVNSCLSSLRAADRVLVVNNAQDSDLTQIAKEHGAVVQEPPTNLGVAKSWNLGISLAADLTIFCSAATLLDPPGLEDWLFRYVDGVERPGFVVPAPVGFHLFGLHRETIGRIGLFDENIYPAYTEDTDFRRRMRLVGLDFNEVPRKGVKVLETAHGTKILGLKGNENDAYFFEKWGCTPNESVDLTKGYQTPWNR